LIEKVGTGVQRIIEAIQARNLSIEFYFGSFFSITFFRPVLPGHQKDILEPVPDKLQTDTKKIPDKIDKSPLEKVEEDITDEASRKCPASIQQALNKFGWTWDKFNGFIPCLSQVCPKSVPCEIAAVILISAQEEINIMDLMKILNKTNRTRFRKLFLDPLIEAGLIVLAIPGKPRSSKQKYIISEKGKNLLEKSPDTFERPSLDKVHPKEYEGEQIKIEPIEAPRKYPASTPQVPRKYPASIQQALNKFGWTWDKFSDFVLSLSQVCPKSVPCEIAAAILISAQEEINMMDLMKILNKTNRTRFKKHCLNPLIEVGFIEFTIPGKPKSSQQKYIITEKGKMLLKKYQD
jgi:predicted transcriptional regulator